MDLSAEQWVQLIGLRRGNAELRGQIRAAIPADEQPRTLPALAEGAREEAERPPS